jgi:hypothetical protein
MDLFGDFFSTDAMGPYLSFLLRLLFNTTVVLFLIRFIYYPVTRRKDYFFTYMVIGTIVFTLTHILLSIGELSITVALGLFVLFGIMRFRTLCIPIKEMTYLFLVIGLSVINSIHGIYIGYLEIFTINTVVLFLVWLCEKIWLERSEISKTIVFEKLELIKPGAYDLLKEELEERLGTEIIRFQIGRVDYLKAAVKIKVFIKKHHRLLYLEEFDPESGDNEGQ